MPTNDRLTVQADSRKIQPGDTFVALHTPEGDGHRYIPEAIARGAARIVADHPIDQATGAPIKDGPSAEGQATGTRPEDVRPAEGQAAGDRTSGAGVEILLVDDTRAWLRDHLETCYKPRLSRLGLIGITGTNGKTTSAHLLYQALNRLGQRCAYIGTVGFYGVDETQKKETPAAAPTTASTPTTAAGPALIDGSAPDGVGGPTVSPTAGPALVRLGSTPNTTPDLCEMYDLLITCLNQGYRWVVLEASSQGLALGRVDTIDYDYAIWTNLTHDHLDFHKTVANYIESKQLLFRRLRPGGKAILNFDDPHRGDFTFPENTNITYGFEGGDYQVVQWSGDRTGTDAVYRHDGRTNRLRFGPVGQYNLYNLMAIIPILTDLGYSDADIRQVVPGLQLPPGRLDTIWWGTNRIVVDYSHTPDGFEKIITTIQAITPGRVFVVFGERGSRDRSKRPEMTKVATTLAAHVIVTNNHLYGEDPHQIIDDLVKDETNTNFEVVMDRREAIRRGIGLLEGQDALLILGKGHEDYLDVGGRRRIPFDDDQVVREILAELGAPAA